MKYNAYDELMNYFRFEFTVYILLAFILLVGVIKAIIAYREVRTLDDSKNLPKLKHKYDLLISFLAVMGLTSAMFFQGVISDIPLESGHVWVHKSIYLYIASLALFIAQLVLIVITDKKIKNCISKN